MPGRSSDSGMIGSPACAAVGATPAGSATPRAATRMRARMGRATVAPESRGELGGEESNLHLPVPKTGVLPLDHPPTGVARCRYYDARVPAPTVLILAA